MRERSTKLCSSCRILISDIVSGQTYANARWKGLQSDYAALSYSKLHWNGSIAKLQRSARCCPMCDLIEAKAKQLDENDSTGIYQIFVWSSATTTSGFQIGTGDMQRYVKHVSEKPIPKSLTIWSSPASSHISPELGHGKPLNIPSRPSDIQNSTPSLDTPHAFSRAKGWLEECQNTHRACARRLSKLPKRILDLGKDAKNLTISLRITKGKVGRYVTLSYTWGGEERFVTTRNPHYPESMEEEPQYPNGYVLERKTFNGRYVEGKPQFECVSRSGPENIPLDMFPQTLKEGIRVAKTMGFRYLWIDSLCILQGDDFDWAHQGAAMTEIFGNSTMTIAATSNENNDQPMLQCIRSREVKIGGWIEPDGNFNDVFISDRLEVLDLEEKFLSTRGWVFQERLVSPATLHYTVDGMVWECAEGAYAECHQSIYRVPWKAYWRKMSEQKADIRNSEDGFHSNSSNMYKFWYDWVCAYAARDLYDDGDKFPAIAGVAKQFAKTLGCDRPTTESQEGPYVAGLWRNDFRAGLLWHRHNRTETLVPLQAKYVAPSWSWGSVRGALEYRTVTWTDSKSNGPNLEIIKISVAEKVAGTYGQVLSGFATVKGFLQKIVVDRQSHPSVRVGPFQACGVHEGFMNNENVLCTLDIYNPSAPRYYECWCLRVGSHKLRGGREGDVFLLLQRKPQTENMFYRIGFAEADAWFDALALTPNSGLLTSRCLTEVVLL